VWETCLHLLRVFLGLALLATTVIGVIDAAADVRVRGYHRRDGTYVQPHWRSSPNSTPNDNWSTYPNVNPHTGQPGTRSPEPGYGGLYIPSSTLYTPRCVYTPYAYGC
jgi:hypothetical protein